MKILFDSDALFALYVGSDQLHQKAKILLEKIMTQNMTCFVSNIVLQECVTVISYKIGQVEARDFLEKFESMPFDVICLDERIELESWKIFKTQKSNGVSFIDCSNIAFLQSMNLDCIFSFDHFYKKNKIKTFQ